MKSAESSPVNCCSTWSLRTVMDTPFWNEILLFCVNASKNKSTSERIGKS